MWRIGKYIQNLWDGLCLRRTDVRLRKGKCVQNLWNGLRDPDGWRFYSESSFQTTAIYGSAVVRIHLGCSLNFSEVQVKFFLRAPTTNMILDESDLRLGEGSDWIEFGKWSIGDRINIDNNYLKNLFLDILRANFAQTSAQKRSYRQSIARLRLGVLMSGLEFLHGRSDLIEVFILDKCVWISGNDVKTTCLREDDPIGVEIVKILRAVDLGGSLASIQKDPFYIYKADNFFVQLPGSAHEALEFEQRIDAIEKELQQ